MWVMLFQGHSLIIIKWDLEGIKDKEVTYYNSSNKL